MTKIEIYEEALMIIAKTGCMQKTDAEEFWCKKDGSAHSIYCPAGIAKIALQPIAQEGRATLCPKCGKSLIMGVCEIGCGYIDTPAP